MPQDRVDSLNAGYSIAQLIPKPNIGWMSISFSNSMQFWKCFNLQDQLGLKPPVQTHDDDNSLRSRATTVQGSPFSLHARFDAVPLDALPRETNLHMNSQRQPHICSCAKPTSRTDAFQRSTFSTLLNKGRTSLFDQQPVAHASHESGWGK